VFVKVIEQVIEEDGVGHGEESSPPGVAAVVEQQLRVVHERHAKLTLKRQNLNFFIGAKFKKKLYY
jgi:hypothetical protein